MTNTQEPQADRDVGRLYGKVRITSEPNSNALIVTANSKENLAAVEEVLNQLDRPPRPGKARCASVCGLPKRPWWPTA